MLAHFGNSFHRECPIARKELVETRFPLLRGRGGCLCSGLTGLLDRGTTPRQPLLRGNCMSEPRPDQGKLCEANDLESGVELVEPPHSKAPLPSVATRSVPSPGNGNRQVCATRGSSRATGFSSARSVLSLHYRSLLTELILKINILSLQTGCS